jgi:FixJ family two-component response regulator
MMQSLPRPECTVYVVDDDDSARESLKFVLEGQGFAVRTFPSGAEALAGALVPEYGCLVTDYHMPGMDGLDLVSALRMRGNPIPAVLLTGDPNRRVRDRAAAADVPVIAKWNLADDLVGRIHEIVKAKIN